MWSRSETRDQNQTTSGRHRRLCPDLLGPTCFSWLMAAHGARERETTDGRDHGDPGPGYRRVGRRAEAAEEDRQAAGAERRCCSGRGEAACAGEEAQAEADVQQSVGVEVVEGWVAARRKVIRRGL